MKIPTLTVLTFSLAVPAAVAQLDWTLQKPSVSPPALSDVAMAYDLSRDRVVLYGGWDGARDLAETWEFDGATWRKIAHKTNPGPRSTHGMVYDAARKSVVMFGGYCGRNCAIGSTWTFDGKDWAQKKPATSPSARMGFGMAYDSHRQRVVLFGGFCGNTSCVYGDTWEWDGNTWAKVATTSSPSPRFSTRMVYDACRRQLVLYGGRDAGRRYSDTWVFDGKNWKRLSATSAPGPRTAHGLVFDPLRARTLLFGGYDGRSHTNQSWDWDGTQWTRRTTRVAPSARSFFAVTFDTNRGRSVLYGGGRSSGVVGGTYSAASSRPASFARFGRGCRSSAGDPVLDLDGCRLPWLGGEFGLRLSRASSAARIAVLAIGQSRTRWGSTRLPLDLTRFGASGCLVLVSPDVTLATAPRAGGAVWRLRVPSDRTLLGAAFFGQVFVVEPSNALGIVVSNAGTASIGAR